MVATTPTIASCVQHGKSTDGTTQCFKTFLTHALFVLYTVYLSNVIATYTDISINRGANFLVVPPVYSMLINRGLQLLNLK